MKKIRPQWFNSYCCNSHMEYHQ